MQKESHHPLVGPDSFEYIAPDFIASEGGKPGQLLFGSITFPSATDSACKTASADAEMSWREKLSRHVVVHSLDVDDVDEDSRGVPLPRRWLLAVACALAFLWLLMMLAEQKLALTHAEYLDESTFIFSVVGLVAVVVAVLILVLVFLAPSDTWLMIVAVVTITCVGTQSYLTTLAEDDLVFLHHLTNGASVVEGNATFPLVFPAVDVLSLEVVKAFAAFFGLITAIVALLTLSWIKVEIVFELPPDNMADVDTDEEEVAAAEMKRRHTVTRALLPIVAILTLLTMISFLSLCILNASSLLMDLDVTLEATRSRFVFTLASCILVCTLLDYYFHPLESKEMRVLMVSLIMMTISVCHILLLRNAQSHAKQREEKIMSPTRDDPVSFCIWNCTTEASALQTCSLACIEKGLLCDGKVDLVNHGGFIFLPLNASAPHLLFPDELYCQGAFNTIISLNYAISSLTFCLSVVLFYQSRGFVVNAWHRKKRKAARKTRKRGDRDDPNYGSID